MSNHRWCCCDQAIDCCDMQSCSNFVTPTQINIQYSGVITRTYSTGQSVVLADYTWNINSNSAFTMRGNNCTGDAPREFGCPTATLDYAWNVYLWVPEIGNQAWNDPPPPCPSCDAGMNCDWNRQHCLQRQDSYYGIPRTVNGANTSFPSGCCQGRTVTDGPPPVIRLVCCETCGCARPAILYTPSVTVWATAADYYVIDDQKCCVPGTPPGPVTSPGTWLFPAFQMAGKCGCPDGATWNCPPGPYTDPTCDPIPVVPGDPNFGVIACPPPDCAGLPQQVVTQVNSASYSWTCQVSDDPVVINYCNETVTYTDTCQHALTIVVA